MKRALALPIAAVAVLFATLPLAGCSSEQRSLDVKEGEPLHVGDMSYNVALSRFLNPNDTEDAGYLVGQPPPPRDTNYFGVFMTVSNDGSDPLPIGQPMKIVDTRGNTYFALPSTSPYALDLNGTVSPDTPLPEPGSTAQQGAIKAALVLFRLDDVVSENRPIKLEIPGPNGETGSIELDL
jgi:hypothetical protein